MNNELQLAKTRPAIPKTIIPTKPADFLDYPATNPLRSGLPVWKGNLRTAVIEGKMDDAEKFTQGDAINAWYIYSITGKLPILVYCKKEELEWIGLDELK